MGPPPKLLCSSPKGGIYVGALLKGDIFFGVLGAPPCAFFRVIVIAGKLQRGGKRGFIFPHNLLGHKEKGALKEENSPKKALLRGGKKKNFKKGGLKKEGFY